MLPMNSNDERTDLVEKINWRLSASKTPRSKPPYTDDIWFFGKLTAVSTACVGLVPLLGNLGDAGILIAILVLLCFVGSGFGLVLVVLSYSAAKCKISGCRFSLRSLLLVMTILAVILGIGGCLVSVVKEKHRNEIRY